MDTCHDAEVVKDVKDVKDAVEVVQLTIPKDRVYTVDWLKLQSHTIVADCLAECRSNYEAKLAANADHRVRQVQDDCDQRLTSLKGDYDHKLNELNVISEQLRLQLAQCEGVTLTRLEQQRNDHEKVRRELVNEKNVMLEKLDKCSERHSESEERMWNKITELTDRYDESTRGLTHGGVQKGTCGQELVIQTLRQMCLGSVDDVSSKAEMGDLIWKHVYPDTRKVLNCLIEVKFEKNHMKQGRDKLYRDIDRRLKAGEINCAIFFSLTATVANKQKLDVSMYKGIPVIFASREASDVIPAITLVELAFRQMYQVLPLVVSGSEDSEDMSLVSQISESFVTYLHDIEVNNTIIANLEAGAHSLIEQSKILRRNLERMTGDMRRIQGDFGLDRSIVNNMKKNEENTASPVMDGTVDISDLEWESHGNQVIEIIQNHYNKNPKRGYPKYNQIHKYLRRDSLVWLESKTGSGDDVYEMGVDVCKRMRRESKRESKREGVQERV